MPDKIQITKFSDPVGADRFNLVSATLADGILSVAINYGGGCKPHVFQLNWNGGIKDSHPPQIELSLSHNANDDNCFSSIVKTLHFDLKSFGLAERYIVKLNYFKESIVVVSN